MEVGGNFIDIVKLLNCFIVILFCLEVELFSSLIKEEAGICKIDSALSELNVKMAVLFIGFRFA